MKNILRETPDIPLRGRLLASVNFVRDQDLLGKSVLDIGCGFGWFEKNALGRGVTSITGVEITSRDFAAAEKYLNDSRAHFEIGDALRVSLPDASVDTVVSWEVIEHIPKGTESQMFAEVARVLAVGGSFYLSTPNDSFFCNVFDPAWILIGHRHYRPDRLKKLAAAHGLVAEDVRCVAGWRTLISVLDMYLAKWIFKRGPFLEAAFSRHVDAEYARPGFVNVFIRFRKNA